MKTGLTRVGKKPSPASPGNYVRDYVRAKKERLRRNREGSLPPSVKLLPSSKPVPAELTNRDTSITGFGKFGVIFLACLLLFILLTVLR
ncbi:MAG: hypothetical protein ACON38_03970 [Akkermansiaceae bacterium]